MNRNTFGAMTSVDSFLYGSNISGVFRSKDGLNWLPLSYGLPNKCFISELAYFPIVNRLYVASENGVYFQTLDTISPIAVSLYINQPSIYTKQKELSLFILAEEADSMIISEEANFDNASWQKYELNPPFSLFDGEGQKIIYVTFKDISYNFSDTLQATIILDTTPPSSPDSLSSQN